MGKVLDIYSYLLANWLDGGSQVRRGRMQATDIVPEYNVVFTKSSVKKVYRLSGIRPTNLNLAFVDFLRERMFDLNPDVELIITEHNYPTHVDVNSEKFNRQMSRANEAYSSYKEAYDSQGGLARLTGKTYRLPGGGRLRLSKERLDDLYQGFVSYYYLYNHLSAGGTVCLTEIFFEIVGEDLRAVKRAGNDLMGLLGPMSIGCVEVKSVLKTYLSEFGPAMPMGTKLNKKFLPQLLFTEENTTAWTSYKSRGLVGDGSGLLLGMDVRSRLPLAINLFRAPSAQVFLLMAKTGGGKTYAAFQIALSALALGQHCTAIDVKGREWSAINGVVDAKVMSFDDRHQSFVNTLRLDDMPVNHGNAQELYNTAVNGTVQLLSLVVNLQPGEGNPNDLSLVLREAVTKLFSIRRVSYDNPASFKNTAGVKYADLLPILETLNTTNSYTPDQKHMVSLARSRCHSYLGPSGLLSEAFQNEISLADIMTSPMVIFELNKNQGSQSEGMLDVLRVFMISYLDMKKKAALKEQGKFLFSFYEELQRVGDDTGYGGLLNYICADVTGSRSNNATVILLMNSLKILRDEKARDIRSNITSFLVGSCERNDVETFRKEFGLEWLAHQLEIFQDKPQLYRNTFAAQIDTGAETFQTAYKVMFPEELRARFQTRTTLE